MKMYGCLYAWAISLVIGGCALSPARPSVDETNVAAACALQPAEPLPAVSIEPEPNPVGELLNYANDLTLMDLASLRDEYRRLQTLLTHQPSTLMRLRMAMLLGMPGSALQDDVRAEALLKEVVRDAELDTESRTFARMLLNRSVQKVRGDNKRKELAALLKTEQEERSELEAKVKALTSIEKSMSDQQNSEITEPLPDANSQANDAAKAGETLVEPQPTEGKP